VSSDQRNKEGAPAVLRVRLKFADLDTFIRKYSANISADSLLILSRSRKPPPGTTLKFELQLHNGEPVIRGEGEVTWAREYDPETPGKPFGVRVRFASLDAESRAVVERAVAHRQGRGAAGGLSAATRPRTSSAPPAKPKGPPIEALGGIRRAPKGMAELITGGSAPRQPTPVTLTLTPEPVPAPPEEYGARDEAGQPVAETASTTSRWSTTWPETADLDAELHAALDSVIDRAPETEASPASGPAPEPVTEPPSSDPQPGGEPRHVEPQAAGDSPSSEPADDHASSEPEAAGDSLSSEPADDHAFSEPEAAGDSPSSEPADDQPSYEPEAASDLPHAEPEASDDLPNVEPEASDDLPNVEPEAAGDPQSVAPEAAGDLPHAEPEAAGDLPYVTPEAAGDLPYLEPRAAGDPASGEPAGDPLYPQPEASASPSLDPDTLPREATTAPEPMADAPQEDTEAADASPPMPEVGQNGDEATTQPGVVERAPVSDSWAADVDRWAEDAAEAAVAGTLEARPVRITPVVGIRVQATAKGGGSFSRLRDARRAVAPVVPREGAPGEHIKVLRARITESVPTVGAMRRSRGKAFAIAVILGVGLAVAIWLLFPLVR